MRLVTINSDPLGIWVNNYPVIFPFLDSVLAPRPDCYDLAEEWATDLYYFKFVRDEQYMVYLPPSIRTTVEWAAGQLGWD